MCNDTRPLTTSILTFTKGMIYAEPLSNIRNLCDLGAFLWIRNSRSNNTSNIPMVIKQFNNRMSA